MYQDTEEYKISVSMTILDFSKKGSSDINQNDAF